MIKQGFRGNCGSKGKLGMCPSLAEPDSDGIPKTSRKQKQGWNPLLPDAEEQVFLRAAFIIVTVPPEQLQDTCF